MRITRLTRALFVVLFLIPASSFASVISGTLSGPCGSQSVAASYVIDFTATGGDFAAGTGTAKVLITLANESGLYPFQSPKVGNPVLTGFLFNIPATALVAFDDAVALAGSSIFGSNIPGGCLVLPVDQSQKSWYDVDDGTAAGQFGIFANSLGSLRGIRGGIVDPAAANACNPLGDIFSSLYIGGQVRFELTLSNLDESLDHAMDFMNHCSLAAGDNEPFSFAAKFQGTGIDGQGSCRIADPGFCQPLPTENYNWGEVKALYR